MIRTLVIALCVLPLCIPVGACTEGPQPSDGDPRKTRVVCVDEGRVVFDDFARRGASFGEGGLIFTSATTGQRSRVMGACHAYVDAVPTGWKATFPAPSMSSTGTTPTSTTPPGEDE